MESDSRELELKFDDSSQEQIGDLAKVRDELANEMTFGDNDSGDRVMVYSAPDDLIIEEDLPEEENFPQDDYQEDIPEEADGDEDFYDSTSDGTEEFEDAVNDQEVQELVLDSSEQLAEETFEPAPVENDAPVAVADDTSMLLRSRHPVNRPVGTPPLENAQDPEPMTAMEMVIAGKSYGVALRMLREQRNLSYKELEQVTYIQPRFLEALENEDLSILPLVYVIAYIRTLCRFYKVSDDTAQTLVAKLKTQLEYSCNDELMNTLDVDRSGEIDNERKLKNIMTALIGGAVGLIALIVLIVVFASSCGSESDVDEAAVEDNTAAEVTVENAGGFESESVESLLPKPILELPKLPVAE